MQVTYHFRCSMTGFTKKFALPQSLSLDYRCCQLEFLHWTGVISLRVSLAFSHFWWRGQIWPSTNTFPPAYDFSASKNAPLPDLAPHGGVLHVVVVRVLALQIKLLRIAVLQGRVFGIVVLQGGVLRVVVVRVVVLQIMSIWQRSMQFQITAMSW
jgi:hypothetical protein